MNIKQIIMCLFFTFIFAPLCVFTQDLHKLNDDTVKKTSETKKQETTTNDSKTTINNKTTIENKTTTDKKSTTENKTTTGSNTPNSNKTTKDNTSTTDTKTIPDTDIDKQPKKNKDKKTAKKSKLKNKKTPKKNLTKEEALKKKKEDQKKKEEKQTESIEKVLDYGINKQRKEAITMVLKIKNKDLRKRLGLRLIEALKNESDVGVKIKAINVLGELKEKDAAPLFITKLDDPSIDVKIQATYGLKQLDATDSKQKLIEELKKQDFTENSNYTEALLTTLGHFKAKEIIKFVQEKITNNKTSKSLRGYLVIFLGKTESKEPKDFLIKLFKDEDEDKTIRAYAANSLAKLGITEAAKDIKELLKLIDSYPFNKKKNYYNLQIYALAALARMGDKEATPRLINALRSDNAMVRLRAARLLKEIKDKNSVEILIYKMKYDPNAKVRKAAEKALKEMGIGKDGKQIKDDDKDDADDKGKKTKTPDGKNKKNDSSKDNGKKDSMIKENTIKNNTVIEKKKKTTSLNNNNDKDAIINNKDEKNMKKNKKVHDKIGLKNDKKTINTIKVTPNKP